MKRRLKVTKLERERGMGDENGYWKNSGSEKIMKEVLAGLKEFRF